MVPPRTVKLDIISDFLCPWCYVGHVELERALTMARAANLPATFEMQYHPFCLNPSLKCDEAVEKDEYFKNKLGAERWEAKKKLMDARAATDGIKFTFGGVIRQTTLAHRLLLKAWRVGGMKLQIPLLKELFRAFFEEEKDIGDIETLATYADVVGVLSKEEAVTFLESKELEAEVLKMCADAAKKGITGVPFVVIDGKWAVSGGQSADVYFKIFEKLSKHETCISAPQPMPATAKVA
ncbi:thioredoxin-like protein [Rickenella mellea]|uniref:Thioredoxin-like protein n=1 Tax=Rickenella mellea TaxID=50990 RepID=A0A4Y7Q1X6_9AGAM|nr:thioredoxin-like protein [Rickenella mellea]